MCGVQESLTTDKQNLTHRLISGAYEELAAGHSVYLLSWCDKLSPWTQLPPPSLDHSLHHGVPGQTAEASSGSSSNNLYCNKLLNLTSLMEFLHVGLPVYLWFKQDMTQRPNSAHYF
ncbi:hypothetical protein ILYODFUR_029786 [Ilyodon furcidens]|uniref:Uncharacterized protein n=1 Tax=Ilyodon furcidens TaxID=33524 RepID=A0ABV0V773_9TELE